VGAALAVITYLIIRAGLIQGAGINDFGVSAVSALVGLMTVRMTHKLKDIFDSLFGTAKTNADKGEHPAIHSRGIKLGLEKTRLKRGERTHLNARVTNSDGKTVDITVTGDTNHLVSSVSHAGLLGLVPVNALNFAVHPNAGHETQLAKIVGKAG
jgi:hypothetical protein